MKTQSMKSEKKAGIWIDQEAAYIITIKDFDEPVKEKIASGIEAHERFPGEREEVARFHNSIVGDKETKQHRLKNERTKFFKDVLHHVQDCDFLYLFGPGKAKHELENLIEKDKSLKLRIVEVENADNMTEHQIVSKVTGYFRPDGYFELKKQFVQ